MDAGTAASRRPSAVRALWGTLTRLERAKINSPWMALRNAVAVAAPLAIGMAVGNALGAVAVTTGALNVSYSDGRDPYPQRARRMLAWSILGSIAVFVGSWSGATNWAAVSLTFLWAFTAGMMVSISTRAGDLGLNTLVAFIVFAARGETSLHGAFYTALLVLAGGLLQTGLALLFWPLRRYEPERRAVAGVYALLAKEISPESDPLTKAPLVAPTPEVQDTLSALGRDHSSEGERFRLLFDQADRIRMSVFVLIRLRDRLKYDADERLHATDLAECINRLLETTSKLVGAVGSCLVSGNSAKDPQDVLKQLTDIGARIRSLADHSTSGVASEIVSASDVLVGQLRAVAELASHTVPTGLEEYTKKELAQPWKYQMRSWVATLRANLDLPSAFFRHAIRLAVWVTLGDAIGRAINGRRAYWIPMTIAVVLKPDFTATFSRGVLRLAGTFAGLGVATVLYHILPESALTQLFLVGIFTFMMRFIGPANYGVFSVAITGLIVFLIAAAGTSPAEVVLERGINTAIGGVIALIAYAVWPTWERTQLPQALAEMLDTCRAYFRTVVEAFSRGNKTLEAELNQTRRAWRRARSAAEASVDRVSSEPGVTAETRDLLTSILASSHALAHAIMAMEAGAVRRSPQPFPAAFKEFAKNVEFTLYYLSAALRGSSSATDSLPKLRDDYRRLIEASDSFSAAEDQFVLVEADHVTIAINTLREQVIRYTSKSSS